jgi:hypothetical protein
MPDTAPQTWKACWVAARELGSRFLGRTDQERQRGVSATELLKVVVQLQSAATGLDLTLYDLNKV